MTLRARCQIAAGKAGLAFHVFDVPGPGEFRQRLRTLRGGGRLDGLAENVNQAGDLAGVAGGFHKSA
jgi:hypothetical protein